MHKLIKDFKDNINKDGVSKSDITILEDSLGEPIISSNVNMKMFTTERSTVGLNTVNEILELYGEENKNDLKNNLSVTDVLNSYINLKGKLSTIYNLLKTLSELYNDDMEQRILNSKFTMTYRDWKGEDTTDTYALFSPKSTFLQFLFYEDLLEDLLSKEDLAIVKNKILEFKFKITDLNYFNDVNNVSTFLPLNLIINKEFDSYIYSFSFTPVRLTGKDVIEFLKNSYLHKEYVEGLKNSVHEDYHRSFNRIGVNNRLYIDKENIERRNQITNNIEPTIMYLDILVTIIQSMCKQ